MDHRSIGIVLVASTVLLVCATAWWIEQRLVAARPIRGHGVHRAGVHPAGHTRAGRRGGRTRWRPATAAMLRRLLSRHRRRPPDDADVARWCDALARAIRSGDTLVAAVRVVEPPAGLRPHVAPVVLALDRGAGLGTAVTSLRRRSPGLDAVATVVRACATLGGPAAEPLDRVAASLRRRVADTAERRAQSAQARLSAVVLTVLPGAVLGVMIVSSSSVRAHVSTTPGLAAVVAGGTLNAAGWAWMRRIIGGSP